MYIFAFLKFWNFVDIGPSEDILLFSKSFITLLWKYWDRASLSRVNSDKKNDEIRAAVKTSIKHEETIKETRLLALEKKNFKIYTLLYLYLVLLLIN